MTENEKLVWAAAFALAHSHERTWGIAALCAYEAVRHMRKATGSHRSGFTDLMDAEASLKMLDEMRAGDR